MAKTKFTEWHYRIFVFLVIFFSLAVFTKTYIASGNTASRFATVESIVERGTFSIEGSTFFGNAKTYTITGPKPLMRLNDFEGINGTNDKIFVNNHFYSEKPPVLSVLVSPFYWLLHKLGITFSDHGALAVYLMTLFSVGIATSFLGVLFFDFTRKNGISIKYSLVLCFVLVFCTLIFPYSVTFNNHIFSALFSFSAFYIAYFWKENKHSLLAGFLSGLSLAIDLPSGGVFSVMLFAYLIIKKRRLQSLYFIVGLIGPVLLNLILNYYILGDFTLAATNPKYFDYLGSDFDKSNLTGVARHASFFDFIVYSFHMLFGHRGLFLYTPVLILAIYAGIKSAIKKKYFRTEAFLILFSLVIILGYYLVFSVNYSGWTYGIRWYVSFIPMMYILIVPVFKDLKKSQNQIRFFYLLAFISLIFSVVGVYQPWTDMWRGQFSFYNNLMEIIKNEILG